MRQKFPAHTSIFLENPASRSPLGREAGTASPFRSPHLARNIAANPSTVNSRLKYFHDLSVSIGKTDAGTVAPSA